MLEYQKATGISNIEDKSLISVRFNVHLFIDLITYSFFYLSIYHLFIYLFIYLFIL